MFESKLEEGKIYEIGINELTKFCIYPLAAEESETDSEESDVSDSDGEDTSWISWFCNLRGHEFFCEVDDDYIQDDFNLCGLSSQVPYYDYALDLILDVESSHGDMFTEEQNELIESAAEMLYGMIHARYILTSKGMAAMLVFGIWEVKMICVRVFSLDMVNRICELLQSQPISVNIFIVLESYYCVSSCYIDRAYFGTTFPHLFLMTYGSHINHLRAMFQEFLGSNFTSHEA
ncbi:unnamed protein product [Trifolium pratense]|uniref:Uncharacterized protein n=1 Tax=Trifolium pratense TaxID=57577 RepID=A0ACB0K4W0_TRIPR|nr:unnamed protein product [Trifolium pratense]